MNDIVHAHNTRGLDDFDGLSPHQMHRLLYFPFESPELIEFPRELEARPTGPLAELFLSIVQAIDERGIKLTPKGNLPRGVSRQTAIRVLGQDGYERFTEITKISSEEDYQDLFVARNVAQLSGLLRKQRGRLFRTRQCDKLMESSDLRRIFPRLLSAVASRFNWGYRDGYPDLRIVQQSFPFTLRLLLHHGAKWRDTSFYEGAFLRAFPQTLAECSPSEYSTPESMLARCYRLRALERFAVYCGLAEMEVVDTSQPASKRHRIRRLPLLEAAVRLKV